jgi:hypothetical protein
MKDAEWIADSVRHGLIKASFVPSEDLRELRDLLRYRRSLAKMAATEPVLITDKLRSYAAAKREILLLAAGLLTILQPPRKDA